MKRTYSKWCSVALITAIYALAGVAGVLLFQFTEPYIAHPLLRLLGADVLATVIVWAFGLLYENVSVYDPYWSVFPPVAFLLWAFYTNTWTLPVILLLIASWYWGWRLTRNWAITFKGIAHEDWRYTKYRSQHPLIFQLINLFGLNMMPTLVVFVSMLPGLKLFELSYDILPFREGMGVGLGFLVCIAAATIQLIADKQIHDFRAANPGKCCNVGLWKHGRHPNYFGEMSFWWGIWIMYAAFNGFDWFICGPIAMSAMFLGISIPLMEKRQLANKPGYAEYRKQTRILISLTFGITLMLTACHQPTEVTSPDGRTQVTFLLNEKGAPMYDVTKDGKAVLTDCPMGFVLQDGALTENFELTKSKTCSLDETWETVWGEERFIRNHYNELQLRLRHASGRQMDICFRVFDDGFAFRYVFPEEGDSLVILSEETAYRFATEPEVWSIPWRTEYYEALWHKTPMSATDTACSPITLEMADGTYAFMHEAALTDYPAQNFIFDGQTTRTMLTPWQNGVAAYAPRPFATPWRFVILADNLPQLLASRIMLNLNEPCKIEDTSWIKPMKFIGIWWGMHLQTMTWHAGPKHGATTENMKHYLQFAADNNIGGVLAEGWNLGWETWEHFDFTTPYPDWNMDALSRFADSLGVQIVGHNETGGNAADYEKDLDTIYAYHKAHGIHVIKTGYVSPIIRTIDGLQYNRSQAGVRHYRKVIETAAKYHICIDNHEPVMPTGLQRTYPNLLTQEGVRGQEWNAWGTDGGSPEEHVTILPFTRVMAGPVDYTPGVFNFANPIHPDTRVHATLANQLALFVVLYSPLQMACDLPENYLLHPELFKFIQRVPCDWEQSRLLDGKIGDFVVMARQERGTEDWFVGAVTDENKRDITLPLDFLKPDATYEMTVYADGEDADWKSAPYSTKIYTRTVRAQDTVQLHLASGGGCAIQIRCL